ncbi:hypothetical protein [Longilinea arvoryzae]|uniref:hypothetical protein n=1 Tax=Longilinea arvoryzae TaxID=360412 RepID=UPI0012603D58|nr:hypothetical protein [Longilinea arvoryzae]
MAATAGEQQYNFLIVHVDQLDSDHPALISVWVAFTYLADPASISFLPIYPTNRNGEMDLAAHFSLSKEKTISTAFLEQLQKEYNLQWSHVVMIDQKGASYWTRFLTGAEFSQTLDSDNQTLLKPEIDLLGSLCSALRERGSGVLTGLEWNQVIPDHLRTDISLDQVIGEWDRIQKSGLCDVFGQ